MQPIVNKLSAQQLQSDAIFEFIADQLKQDPSKGKAVNAVFLYIITKDGKQAKQWSMYNKRTWMTDVILFFFVAMDLKEGKVFEGTPKDKPNTTLTISDDDFVLLATNKLNPQVAFMKGKLKVTGNVMLAQKLGPLLKANAKL